MAKSNKSPQKDVLTFIGGGHDGDYDSKEYLQIKEQIYSFLYWDGTYLIFDLEKYIKNGKKPFPRNWIHRYKLNCHDMKYHWDGYFTINAPS